MPNRGHELPYPAARGGVRRDRSGVRPDGAPLNSAGIRYGGHYNPEQWPEKVWAEDVALMAETGVDLVTVGVFARGELQPGPGRALETGWLDRVLDLLTGVGVGVGLATATASPPPWLVAAHPSILPVDASGVRLSPGGRQHYCPSSPDYREAAGELAGRMAERYGGHPALELWHVGNEYGCHVPACYCDASAEAFRHWLEARYGGIDQLNYAWGSALWSQRYRNFDEVLPPRAAPTFPNPSQQLDFARFSNDELLACYSAEREVLAAATPTVPVTTNLMGLFRPTDGWARAMDLVSLDRYPDPDDPDAHLSAALAADLTRSLAGGRPWYLMEQAPGAVNWRRVNVPKSRGEYRRWSLQAVARGADAVLQFQWRASAAGAEKYHSGMVPHADTDTRAWQEVVDLDAELRRLAPLAGTLVTADVALLLDWEGWWGLELDLSRYRLVVVPALYLVSDEAAAGLERYVAGGGVAVVTYFSGIIEPTDRVRLGGYPAPWRDLLGLHVDEHAPLPPGRSERLSGPLAHPSSRGFRWLERVRLRGARALLTVASEPLTGQPAATVHDCGQGAAYYLATTPDPATLDALVADASGRAGVNPTASVPPGVEAVERGGHLVLINHLDRDAEVDLGHDGRRDLLSGSVRSGGVTLTPGEVLVLAPATPTEPAPKTPSPVPGRAG